MTKTKTPPYGVKKKLVWKWLEESNGGYANYFIAARVGCHDTYVGMIRKDFEARTPKGVEGVFAHEGIYDDEELLLDTPLTVQHTPSLSVDVSDILDTRAKDYGVFAELSKVATGIKAVVREGIANNTYSRAPEPDQLEALDMIASKMARIVNGNPDVIDHWDDLAGYAMLVSERLKGRSR